MEQERNMQPGSLFRGNSWPLTFSDKNKMYHTTVTFSYMLIKTPPSHYLGVHDPTFNLIYTHILSNLYTVN